MKLPQEGITKFIVIRTHGAKVMIGKIDGTLA